MVKEKIMNSKKNNAKKRPALGRGLSALVSSSAVKVDSKNEKPTNGSKKPKITVISGSNEAEKNGDINNEETLIDSENSVAYISISSIYANPNQPRKNFSENELSELSSSIKELGVLQPILVKKDDNGKYMIVAGERRYRASKLANLNKVPVIIKDFDDRTTMEVALVENIQRSNLNVIEEARAYQALIDDFNVSHENLAKRLGKSRSNITNYIRLLSLPDKILDLVKNQTISMGHARALLTVKEPAVQANLAKKCIDEKLSVRDLEAIVGRKISLEEDKKELSKSDKIQEKYYPEIVDELRKILGTKVSIKHDKKKKAGKISIQYFSESELNRIVEVFRG